MSTCIDAYFDTAQFDISKFDYICSNFPLASDVTTSKIYKTTSSTTSINSLTHTSKETNKSTISNSDINKSTHNTNKKVKASISIGE